MSELTDLRESIIDLTKQLRAGSSPTGTPNAPAAAKGGTAEAAMSRFAGMVAGLASVSTVLKGLSGTVEGYNLDRSFGMLAYAIADLVRGPIRFLTTELYGLGRIVNKANESLGPEKLGIGGIELTGGGLLGLLGFGKKAAEEDREPPAGHILEDSHGLRTQLPTEREKREKDEHIKPIYTTSFGSLTSLWEMLQSKVTENPVQQQQLSILERIYNWLVSHTPGSTKNDLIKPEPFGGT